MDTTTEHVWVTFHTSLRQFIRRRVSDDATAEDLLQDVFLDIHQHVDTLRDVKKLEPWIYQITRNTIIDYQPRCACCTDGACYTEESAIPTRRVSMHPF